MRFTHSCLALVGNKCEKDCNDKMNRGNYTVVASRLILLFPSIASF